MLEQRDSKVETPLEVAGEDLLGFGCKLVAEACVPALELAEVVGDPRIEELDLVQVLAVLARRLGRELRTGCLGSGIECSGVAEGESRLTRYRAEPGNCERALRTEGLRGSVASLIVGVREARSRDSARERYSHRSESHRPSIDHWSPPASRRLTDRQSSIVAPRDELVKFKSR
jgi:hypothetical protein